MVFQCILGLLWNELSTFIIYSFAILFYYIIFSVRLTDLAEYAKLLNYFYYLIKFKTTSKAWDGLIIKFNIELFYFCKSANVRPFIVDLPLSCLSRRSGFYLFLLKLPFERLFYYRTCYYVFHHDVIHYLYLGDFTC